MLGVAGGAATRLSGAGAIFRLVVMSPKLNPRPLGELPSKQSKEQKITSAIKVPNIQFIVSTHGVLLSISRAAQTSAPCAISAALANFQAKLALR